MEIKNRIRKRWPVLQIEDYMLHFQKYLMPISDEEAKTGDEIINEYREFLEKNQSKVQDDSGLSLKFNQSNSPLSPIDSTLMIILKKFF